MAREVDTALHANQQRLVGRRNVVPRVSARTRDAYIRDATALGNFSRQRFGHRTPACVAAANEEKIHDYAFPTRSGTLSLNLSAEIAPGRMTRGSRPVQSTTVEGCDSSRRPPSSTRRVPRRIASLHWLTIWSAAVAGGTPGRLALVDVIGSPWARISRASERCGVHLTATPPSGPRKRSGTRFSPPGRTSVSGPGQNLAAKVDA